MLYSELCYRQLTSNQNELCFDYTVCARSFDYKHIMEIVKKYNLDIIDENNRLNCEDGFVITRKSIDEFESLDEIESLSKHLNDKKIEDEKRKKEFDDICNELYEELFGVNGCIRQNKK